MAEPEAVPLRGATTVGGDVDRGGRSRQNAGMKLGILPPMLCLLGPSQASEIIAPFDAGRAQIVSQYLDGQMPDLLAAYKHFHANPELSLQELKTSARIAKVLKEAGYEVTSGVGGTGVVAVLENGAGPTILIRGDMDALPVVEQTGLPYASKVKLKADDGTMVGAMHACGHDVHITMVIGVGRALAELREHWGGTVVMIAQPAEEVGKGARMMIADGLFGTFPETGALPVATRETRQAGGHRRPARRLGGGERRFRRHHDLRQGRPRRQAARQRRPDRRRRADRRRPTDPGQPPGRPDRARRGDRRLLPRRDEAQHHPPPRRSSS